MLNNSTLIILNLVWHSVYGLKNSFKKSIDHFILCDCLKCILLSTKQAVVVYTPILSRKSNTKMFKKDYKGIHISNYFKWYNMNNSLYLVIVKNWTTILIITHALNSRLKIILFLHGVNVVHALYSLYVFYWVEWTPK